MRERIRIRIRTVKPKAPARRCLCPDEVPTYGASPSEVTTSVVGLSLT